MEAISNTEREIIHNLRKQNEKNLKKLQNLESKNKMKTRKFYGKQKLKYKFPKSEKKKRDEEVFKKRMTLYQIKRKRSLAGLRKELTETKEMTFQPKINPVSKKLTEDVKPFIQR